MHARININLTIKTENRTYCMHRVPFTKGNKVIMCGVIKR